MPTSRDILKTYFENGKKPSEQDFEELIDSLVHQDDDVGGSSSVYASISEAELGVSINKDMSPFLVKKAINALTRLSNIPALNAEVDDKVSGAINQLLSMNDADAVINTVKEVVDAFNGMSESDSLIDLFHGKEDSFSKGTAFNKNFGTGYGRVARGNHVILAGFAKTVYGIGNTRTLSNLIGQLATSSPTLTDGTLLGVSFKITHNYGHIDYGFSFEARNTTDPTGYEVVRVLEKTANSIEYTIHSFNSAEVRIFNSGVVETFFKLHELNDFN